MKNVKSAALALSLALAGSTQATPVNLAGSETSLQNVLNGITCQTGPGCVLGGTSSTDVQTHQAVNDQVWSLGASSAAFSQIVIEIAGYAPLNTFGIYDIANPNRRVELFNGAASSGAQSLLTLASDGSVWSGNPVGGGFVDSGVDFSSNLFGFYLGTPGGMFFSQNGLNSDSADHLVAFQGNGDHIKLPGSPDGSWLSNDYLLAWEDLPSSSWDYDYNDFVVMVSGVHGVPEPGSLALLAMGLLAMAFSVRRRTVRA